MASQQKVFLKINGNSSAVQVDTSGLFRAIPARSESPIDNFVKRNRALIIKVGELISAGLLNDGDEDDSYIFNLFLLGFISNVESYFRAIIRETINVDLSSYNTCLSETLTFAAAVHHGRELLPEALLETTTFISKKNITDAVKNYLGISLHPNDANTLEVKNCLEGFESLCQLRHCIVHRAGLLGSQNAVKLGIEFHKNYFEHPITLDRTFLQSAGAVCLNAVRTSNNLLFNRLIERVVMENTQQISWRFPSDRVWFNRYFELYRSELLDQEIISAGNQPLSSFQAYDLFRTEYASS